MKDVRTKFGSSTAMANAIVLIGLVALVASWNLTATAQANDEAAVRDVLLRSASSFARNDLPEATKIWANDESLTILERGHAKYGWPYYRDHTITPQPSWLRNTMYDGCGFKF